jgi:hypothetical protein
MFHIYLRNLAAGKNSIVILEFMEKMGISQNPRSRLSTNRFSLKWSTSDDVDHP